MSQDGNPGQEAGTANGAGPGDISPVDGDQMIPPPIEAAAQLPIANAPAVAATPQTSQEPTPPPKPAPEQPPLLDQPPLAMPTQPPPWWPPPQQPQGLTVETESRIVDQLLNRLQEMGIAGQPPPTPPPVKAKAPAKAPPPAANAETEPGQENWDEQGWHNQGWDQNQKLE